MIHYQQKLPGLFARQSQIIAGGGTICALAYSWLALRSHSTGNLPLSEFCVIVVVISAVILCLFLALKKDCGAIQIIVFALLCRLIGYYGAPLYEDDFYRYLWDGYRFATTGTPYGAVPEAFFGDASLGKPLQQILSGINHPDIPTLYAPTLQYLFLLAYSLEPAQLWPLKLILISVDALVLLLLSRHVQARYLLLYAWNPLVVKEIAFTAHPDGLLGGLLLATWILLVHGKHRFAGGLTLALAAATKIASWPLLPFFLIRCGLIGVIGFVLGIALLYLPFFLQGTADFFGLFAFAENFEFNSAVFAVVHHFFPTEWVRPLLGLTYIAAVGLYFLHRLRSPVSGPPRIDVLLGGLLLISPVINPWYLLWLLPWACITPTVTLWTASVAVLLSYATGLNLDDPQLSPYGHPDWVRPVEFGVILTAFVCDLYRNRTRHQFLFEPKISKTWPVGK